MLGEDERVVAICDRRSAHLSRIFRVPPLELFGLLSQPEPLAALLGRPLTVDEIAYFTHTIRRIAGLLLLAPQLDANYAAVKSNTYEWQEK